MKNVLIDEHSVRCVVCGSRKITYDPAPYDLARCMRCPALYRVVPTGLLIIGQWPRDEDAAQRREAAQRQTELAAWFVEHLAELVGCTAADVRERLRRGESFDALEIDKLDLAELVEDMKGHVELA